MSSTIRTYKKYEAEGHPNAEAMTVTAFCGNRDTIGVLAVQIEINGASAVLSETQQLDLIATLSQRLMNREGYSGSSDDNIEVSIDGKTQVLED